MRAPSLRVADASPVAGGVLDGPALEFLQQFCRVRRRRSLMSALAEPAVSDVVPPEPETSWNFTAMGAAEPKDDASARPEPDLVENIARAMQNRPLMRRLANLAGEDANAVLDRVPPPLAEPMREPALEGAFATPETLLEPADFAPAPPEPETELERMKRRILEAEGWSMPPQSAEWLDKAQRERNRTRLRNFVAWMATLAIGGTIIATTALIMQP